MTFSGVMRYSTHLGHPATANQSMQGGQAYESGLLSFHNNYALNEEVGDMPERDLSVEMWVRTPAYKPTPERVQRSELLSYATHTTKGPPSRKPFQLVQPSFKLISLYMSGKQAGCLRFVELPI